MCSPLATVESSHTDGNALSWKDESVPGRVQGKVAFITGAARGQGRSHAIRLAGEGADIIAVDACQSIDSVPYALASRADLDETARSVRALGRQIYTAVADVRDFGALEAVANEGVAELGRLDIVVSNAGVLSIGPLLELSEKQWTDVVDVNLTGAFHTIKAAVPHVVAGGRGGSVIITSSGLALTAAPNVGHYIATKTGLIGLMRALALELASKHIRVNSIHPTTVDTPMIHHDANYRLFRPDLVEPVRADAEAAYESINALPIPWVEPIDVSNVVLFLASDEARYLTGMTMPVDAGSTLL